MTDYIDPGDVTSPRSCLTDHHPISDQGAGKYSVALLKWNNNPRVGVRWNGNLKNERAGNPQSRGLPTWFVVPTELEQAILHWMLDTGSFGGGKIDAAQAEMRIREHLASTPDSTATPLTLERVIREVVLGMRKSGEL